MDKKQARLSKVRERATQILKNSPPNSLVPNLDTDVMLEELQIHQIELELQLEAANQAYAALESSQQRYDRLYNGTSIAYFSLDAHGMIVNANLSAGRLLGWDRYELRGKRFASFVVSEFQSIFYSANYLVRMGEEGQSYEMGLCHRDGTKLVVIVNTDLPSAESDEILLAVTNLSVLKNHDGFPQGSQMAQELNLLRLTTLATLAPEFRKPLAVIFANIELLQKHSRQLSKKRSNQIFDTMRNLVCYLNDCLHDAKTVQELDEKQAFQIERFDVLSFTQQIVNDMEAIGDGQAIRLQISGSPENAIIRWSRNLYRRILMNLIGSLFKYSNESIDCQVEMRETSLSLSLETQTSSLFEADLAQIFEAATKLKTNALVRGRGNGLMLVHDMVWSHGGTMRYLSKTNQGIGFYLSLPKVQIDASPYQQ